MEIIENSMKRWTWNEVEKCWELMMNGQIGGDEGNGEDGVDQLNGLGNHSNIESAEAQGEEFSLNRNVHSNCGTTSTQTLEPFETLSSQQSSEKEITLQRNEESSLQSSSQHLVRECRIDDAEEKVDNEMESIESSMKRWTWNEVEKCWELKKNGQVDGDERNASIQLRQIQQQQISKLSNDQTVEQSNIVSLTNSSYSSSSQILNPVTESTHPNEQPKHVHQVIEKPSHKCEWAMCDRVFVGLEDLQIHILDVHVGGFDEEDGEDEGEVSVQTQRIDEQSIEQVNTIEAIHQDESTLSEIVSDGQSCATSHDHAYDHQIDHLPSAPLSASLICSFTECVDLTFNHQPSLHRHTRLKHSQSLHPIHCKFSNVRRPTQSNHVLKIVVTSKSKCLLCDKWFECIEIHVIQEHTVMEVVTGGFGKCTRTFESDQKLEIQRAVHQEPEPQFIELLADYDYDEKSMFEIVLEDYTDLDEQSMDEMDYDEEELQQSEHQQTHLELNKSTNEPKSMNSAVMNWRPYRCFHCDDSFEKVDELKNHFEVFHTSRTVVTGVFGKCMTTLTTSQQQHEYQTEEEGNSNETNSRAITLGLACPECSVLFKFRPKLEQHLFKLHNKLPFKCMIRGCNRQFESRFWLNDHYKIHSTKQNFKWTCSAVDCTFETSYRNIFMSHVHENHEKGLFQCSSCLVQYPYRRMVYKHYAKTHIFKKSFHTFFPCPVDSCLFVGRTNWNLKIHQLTAHSVLRPFQCTWPDCLHFADDYLSACKHVQTTHLQIADSKVEATNIKCDSRQFVPYEFHTT